MKYTTLDTLGMVGYLAGDSLDRESSFFTSPQQGKNGPKICDLNKRPSDFEKDSISVHAYVL